MEQIKYKKSDFKMLSWEEYGEILENLYKKVNKYLKNNKIKIDAVVPILRGGAFSGIFLAYKLHILRIIPVQYKHLGINLVQFISINNSNLKLPHKPVFLLVENNHCFGETAVKAAEDLKKKFPKCKIIYAAALADFSHINKKIFDRCFYGELTNETKTLSNGEAKSKKVRDYLSLFPWEDINEEYAAVCLKDFKYL